MKKAVDDEIGYHRRPYYGGCNAGPVGAGYAGMGHALIPTKLVKQGVRDMIRITGWSYQDERHKLWRLYFA